MVRHGDGHGSADLEEGCETSHLFEFATCSMLQIAANLWAHTVSTVQVSGRLRTARLRTWILLLVPAVRLRNTD